MNLSLQAKLLRVLQYKVYEQIGSSESINIDVRIVAASNKNLFDLVKEKKFREDLYYRLNVIPLNIPPLRDRKDDIEELSLHFLRLYSNKKFKTISDFTQVL